jgi:hypothetical protein
MRPAAKRVPPFPLPLAGVDCQRKLADLDQRVRHPNQRGYEPIALAGKRIMLAAKRLRIFRRLQFDATRGQLLRSLGQPVPRELGVIHFAPRNGHCIASQHRIERFQASRTGGGVSGVGCVRHLSHKATDIGRLHTLGERRNDPSFNPTGPRSPWEAAEAPSASPAGDRLRHGLGGFHVDPLGDVRAQRLALVFFQASFFQRLRASMAA